MDVVVAGDAVVDVAEAVDVVGASPNAIVADEDVVVVVADLDNLAGDVCRGSTRRTDAGFKPV